MEPVFGQLVYGNGLAAFFLQKMEGILWQLKIRL